MAVEFANDTTKRAGALYTDLPENIIIMPDLNGRHEVTDIEALAADIEANGQDTPVALRKNDQGLPVLIYGHRRWMAICLINKRKKPGQTKMNIVGNYYSVTEAEAFEMAIRENHNRKAPSAMDDCANINMLRKRFKYPDEAIAKIYFPEAKDETEKAAALRFVKQRGSLIELAPEAAQGVREGRVKVTTAVVLAKMTREQQREKMAQSGKVKTSDVAPPKKKAVTIKTLIAALLTDIGEGDLENTENEFIAVDRKKLRKVVLAVGIDPKTNK